MTVTRDTGGQAAAQLAHGQSTLVPTPWGLMRVTARQRFVNGQRFLEGRPIVKATWVTGDASVTAHIELADLVAFTVTPATASATDHATQLEWLAGQLEGDLAQFSGALAAVAAEWLEGQLKGDLAPAVVAEHISEPGMPPAVKVMARLHVRSGKIDPRSQAHYRAGLFDAMVATLMDTAGGGLSRHQAVVRAERAIQDELRAARDEPGQIQ